MIAAKTTADRKLTATCRSVWDASEVLEATDGGFDPSSDRGSATRRAGSDVCVAVTLE
jgi:hypothetical protein